MLCATFEAVILAVLWYVMPPSHPASAVSQFAYSFLLGLGLIAGLRVKGLWKKLLLLVPALAAMILCETIMPRLAEALPHSPGPYMCGIFFGILLMASGFNPVLGKRFEAVAWEELRRLTIMVRMSIGTVRV